MLPFDGFPRNGNQKNAFRYLPSSANGDRTLRPKYEASVAEENGEFRHEYSGQPHDTAHELLSALTKAIASPHAEPYISQTIKELLQHSSDELTTKEWEVLNLINQGYSLSQIASKKCRAMSTVSTQKRKAMDKLHLANESELQRFLHQNTFFNH
ncbi:hypothetical protein DMB90_04905 [Raoultella planticola]|uniref:HTH luxR-type domain-containing protein n=1 Tax=Raoultella planticola TaxID=575 RepID=A0A5P6A992_RAOPL|nr:hypothetical protein DMB90_04905 [Raoultella planticola]